MRSKTASEDKLPFYEELALLSSRSQNYEIALEIMLEGEKLNLRDAFTTNAAVMLSQLGRHEEAIEKASTMNMDIEISYSILGNILWCAGRKKEALTNYLCSIQKNLTSLHLIENGISASIELGELDSLNIFYGEIELNWMDYRRGRALAGLILYYKGRLKDAIRELEEALIENKVFVFPAFDGFVSDNENGEIPKNDTIILHENNETDFFHFLLARTFMKRKEFLLVSPLVKWGAKNEKINPGAWALMFAECERQRGATDVALNLLINNMEQVPPVLIAIALCKFDQRDHQEALNIVEQILVDRSIVSDFIHPLGNPIFIHPLGNIVALAHILKSEILFIKQQYDEALKHTQYGQRIDPYYIRGYISEIEILNKTDNFEKTILVAERGLVLCPGDPGLTEYAVDYYIKKDEFHKAEKILEINRASLDSYGEGQHAALLGERIASEQNKDKSPEQIIILEIKNGETANCEFKSTLRYDIKAEKNEKAITHACLKSMAGFLNTEGGTLYIGVSDVGEILGLKNDNYKNKDHFVNTMFNFIDQALGKHAATLIKAEIFEIEGKQICKVLCNASSKPTYLGWDNKEEFFVRTGPSTRSMKVSEVPDYIRSHFKPAT